MRANFEKDDARRWVARMQLQRGAPVAERLFREKGNPFFAWWVFRFCRECQSELPGWVTEYLDECSARLGGLVQTKPKNTAEDIQSAFGFAVGKGRRSALTDFLQRADDLEIAEKHDSALGKEGKSFLADAFVAERTGKPVGTVRSAVKRARERR